VHLLRAVDDNDAPALLRRGQPKKPGDRARVLDDDLAAQPAATRIIGALDGEQIGMAAGCYPAEHAALWIDRQPLPAAWRAEQEPGEPKGERRLADTARPAQQDGMRQPSRLDEPAQLALGLLVPYEIRVFPRCEHASRSVARCPSPSRLCR